MKFPWFKLPSGIRNDPKLRRMPIHQRYAFIVLLCLASESEERGTILGLDDEDLAFELEMALEDWLTLKAKFRVKGLIDFDLTTVTICDWDCMQYDKPSDRAEETRRRKQEQRARDAAKKALQESLVSQDVTPVTPLSREVTLPSHDVTQNVTQNRGEETREDKSREEENARGEGIYTPPVENFPKPCQPTQEVLISVDMAEEIKETPPPTPAPLPPENVGLAIASTEKPKKRKRNVTSEDLIPFRDVWNSDAPVVCVRFKELTAEDEKSLRRFLKAYGNRSATIFQEGLAFARTQKWWNDTSENKALSITNYLSHGKPEEYAGKYRGLIERGVLIPDTPNQNNTDRPMTQSDLKNAEKFVRLKKELLTA